MSSTKKIVKTVDISARVTAIDKVNRKVTLLKHDGEKSMVKVGPEAVNFDQIKKGEPEMAVAVVLMFFFFESSNRVSFRGILLRIDAVGY